MLLRNQQHLCFVHGKYKLKSTSADYVINLTVRKGLTAKHKWLRQRNVTKKYNYDLEK